MPIEVKVPEVGESISEVQIGEWLKNEGDFVERDDEVVIIETDKATVEVSAPESGTITKILKRPGQTASVHEVIGYIDPGERPAALSGQRSDPEAQETPAAANSAQPAATSPHISGTTDDDRRITPPASGPVEVAPTQQAIGRREESAKNEAQAVEIAKAVAEAGAETLPEQEALPPRPAPARRDSESAAKAQKSATVELDVDRGPEAAAVTARKKFSERSSEERPEEIVAMSHLRRRIAERLVEAQQNAASLTTFNEVDMSAIIGLRQRYREGFKEKHQAKLGFMSFFVKATVDALRLIPEVNAEIRGADIVYRNFFDIGIAVGGGKGLVVPVLRNAERLSFAEIERAIADFARRAEQGKLAPAELQGGTFTISNGGIYGSLLSTPIVNPPQCGILGLHAIQERPVARDSAIVIRPMMYVALTYDHRLIDGREAVTFLKHVKDLIEDPARLLLEI